MLDKITLDEDWDALGRLDVELGNVARRAEGYYGSARKLLPLIDPQSRPAMWVLFSIYHRLLERIRQADYDVFSRRASVPLLQKLGILTLGQARLALARLPGST